MAKSTGSKTVKKGKLVIVESPAKAGTIKKYLGKDYKVMASMGHLIDLPKSKLGIDPENNYEPKYITIRGKAELVNSLKKEFISQPTPTAREKPFRGILRGFWALTKAKNAV